MNHKKCMDVVVHIGAPKTGSSAIQFFLHANRKRLLKHGYYYPEHNFDENNVSGGHAHLGAAVAANELPEAERLLNQWLTEAEQLGARLLLSSEALYRHSVQVKQLLKGCRVKVLAYFRHPLESLVSNHNQSIKRHYSTQTLDDFLYKQVGISNRGVSGQVFFDWVKHFGKDAVSVRPYLTSAFVKQQIELDFLARLGIEGWAAWLFKRSNKRINTSYTYGALEIKRLLNTLLDQQNPKESRLIDRALQAHADRINNKQVVARQLVSTSVYEAIVERYRPALDRARAELLADCSEHFYRPQSIVPVSSEYTGGQLQQVIEAYQWLATQLPGLIEELQQRLLQQLAQQRAQSDEKSLPYALLKLAEVMGLPIVEPKIEQPLPSTAMDTFLSDKSNRVDYLREIARWLERHDQTEPAIKVLAHAQHLAEKGGMTGERLKAVKRQLASYEQRLQTQTNETDD